MRKGEQKEGAVVNDNVEREGSHRELASERCSTSQGFPVALGC